MVQTAEADVVAGAVTTDDPLRTLNQVLTQLANLDVGGIVAVLDGLMAKTVIQFIALFLALLVLQLVCNKIVLFNVAMPVVFIYLILRLPVNLHGGWVLTIAFFMGLIIDIFDNTPGMNALACTMMAAVRRPVFNLFVSREDDLNIPLPSVASMGVGDYFKYMATLVTLYCALIFAIQAFTLHKILLTLARIAGSSVLSIIVIFGLESLVSTRREKRL